MSDNNNKSDGNIGFLGWLTLLFIGLKLTGYIEWSWWWVLCPIWIPLSIGFGLFGIVFCIKVWEEYRR